MITPYVNMILIQSFKGWVLEFLRHSELYDTLLKIRVHFKSTEQYLTNFQIRVINLCIKCFKLKHFCDISDFNHDFKNWS